MSGTDRDLVAALRAELAAVDPARPCDRRAEIAGLGPLLVTREATVARLAVRLGGRATESRTGTSRHSFHLPDEPFEWNRAAEHCRLAWLRGRFLAHGSLSLTGGRAHLEFVVPIEEAAVLAERLAAVGLPASWRVRRGFGVVTWKSAEAIAGFLGRIGASASLLELEARSVARSLRGDLNRVLNAESANLQRSVAAAGRQLAAIAALDSDGRLGEQPRTVRAVAEARRETPEASLSEIAERLDLHRSAVQRALDRLERLALHDDERIGRRYPSRRRGVSGDLDGREAPPRRAVEPRRPGRPDGTEGPTGRGSRSSPLA
jgi:DNA-binding transcriptional ArsR family regulator